MMVMMSGRLKKGRQYNKRRIRNKKHSDKLELITLPQVEQVVAPNSDPSTHPDQDVTSRTPSKRTLELLLDTLQRRDTHELFAEPVDPDEVEDYYEIINDPMDFGTMRAKLHEDMYQSLHQFEHDVFLIFRNAMHFNSSSTVYFKQARTLNDMATKVFHALRTDPGKFELEMDTTKRRSARNICSGDRDSYFPSPPNGERRGLLFTTEGTSSLNLDTPAMDLDLDFTMMYAGSTPLVPICQQDISYRESLVEFVKDLGPTAKRVAQRKLQEAESSKVSDLMIILPAADNNTTHNKATKRSTPMARNIINKKIVLAVPAAPRPIRSSHAKRSSRACKSATTTTATSSIGKLPKTRKIPVAVKTAAKDLCGHVNDLVEHKGAMTAPSWQLNNSFGINTPLIGSTTATQLNKVPRSHYNGKDTSVSGPGFGIPTNTIKNAVSSSYQYQGWQLGSLGSTASNIRRDVYFDMSYIRSKLNGSIKCKIPE